MAASPTKRRGLEEPGGIMVRARLKALAWLVLTSVPVMAAQQAQPPAPMARPAGMSAGIAAGLREIGPRIEGAKTAALYAPLHAGLDHGSVELRRDLAYGPDERHRADVYTQKGATGGLRPMLVFVYGGGFRGGAKSAANSPFYDNIGYWAAERGMVGVTLNYRLAPAATYPAGAEDVERAVAWLREHAREWGADPARIVLWGHSSGAAHVGSYLARTPQPPVIGAILMSGIYAPTAAWSAYYGEDPAKYAGMASLPGLIQQRLPLFVVWAELDPPEFIPDTEQLIAGRQAGGRPTISLRLPNHSHISEAYAIGTADDSLSAPVLNFIQSLPR